MRAVYYRVWTAAPEDVLIRSFHWAFGRDISFSDYLNPLNWRRQMGKPQAVSDEIRQIFPSEDFTVMATCGSLFPVVMSKVHNDEMPEYRIVHINLSDTGTYRAPFQIGLMSDSPWPMTMPSGKRDLAKALRESGNDAKITAKGRLPF